MSTTPYAANFALIAFDLDGTLIDSEARSLPNLLTLLREHYGLNLTLAHWMTHYHGMAGPNLLTKLNADHDKTLVWEEFWPRRFAALEADLRANGLEPAPGMLQMLRRIAARGQQMCIVSNSNPARIALSLELTQGQRQHGVMLPALFEGHVISGTDPAHPTRQSKPAPDAYLAAAEIYKVLPNQCLAIEDSATGVKAAVAAGFECWGYTALSQVPNPAAELKAAGASRIFTHWDEFLP